MKKITFSTALLSLTLIACSGVAPNDTSSSDAAKKARTCQELREELEELEGKPLRRSAHLEYYEDLCLNPDAP